MSRMDYAIQEASVRVKEAANGLELAAQNHRWADVAALIAAVANDCGYALRCLASIDSQYAGVGIAAMREAMEGVFDATDLDGIKPEDGDANAGVTATAPTIKKSKKKVMPASNRINRSTK